MRPRSRLLAKKRLPTIREGYEELLQDMNQANSYHTQRDSLSSEDYLLSIRQLARPAFPLREQDHDILTLGQLEALKPGLALRRLPVPSRPLTPTTRSSGYWEQEAEKREGSNVLGTDQNDNGESCRAAPDPLEYLYGRRDAPTCVSRDTEGRLGQGGAPETGRTRSGPRPLPRSQSFPRPCSPPRAYRKSSCPEIRLADAPSPTLSGNRPTVGSSEMKPGVSLLPGQCEKWMSPPAGDEQNCSRPTDKHSMISSWIIDCRNAWQEARMKACMLPTIAEI